MKPIVYVVHVPSRWETRERRMVPLDMSPAVEHGEMRVIFPGHDRPPEAQGALPVLVQELAGFRACDLLALVGNMDLVVWASALALKATGGKLNLLRWNNRNRRYDVIKAPDGLGGLIRCDICQLDDLGR